VCPPQLFDELYARLLHGRLAELAAHPSANYAVQVRPGPGDPIQLKTTVKLDSLTVASKRNCFIP
jgi:hypothetical protein